MVCDFGYYTNRVLYLWNVEDTDRMKDVPFFCYSHLVMRFQVKGCPTPLVGGYCRSPAGTDFQPPSGPSPIVLDRVLSQADIDAAHAMVAEGRCTRTFKFGRRPGHW